MKTSDQATIGSLSIIIVAWNKADITRQCVASVVKYTRIRYFEIIVVNNGSDENERISIERLCIEYNCRLISLKRNVFFGEANNIAVEAAYGDAVILLNNDTVVTDGYDSGLLSALVNAPLAGAVGPRFIYPSGRLQEAGAFVLPNGHTFQHGKNGPESPLIGGAGLHLVDYCSAACLAMRRRAFLEMGGFDPTFDPAYFEDVDLAIRLRSHGLFTYYCGDVVIIHFEGASANESTAKYVNRNQRKLLLRWGEWLNARLQSDIPPPVIAPKLDWTSEPALADESFVAVVGDGCIQETDYWRRTFEHCSYIAESYPIVLVAEERASRCRVMTLAERWHCKFPRFLVRRASDYDMSAKSVFRSLGDNIEQVS
jgi:GT2 family glycosyltransferase